MMKGITYILISIVLTACGGSKQLSQDQQQSDKLSSNKDKIMAMQNTLTFDCANGPVEIKHYEYFRLPMSCCCEIIDSVKVGNAKYIDYVVSWIENTSISTINGGCNFSCRTKADPVGGQSELRGKRIFEALLKRIIEEEGGFDCPTESEGLFYPVKTLYRHIVRMIDNIDGQSYNEFYRIHGPDINSLYDKGVDIYCFGVGKKEVILALAEAYKQNKVVLKVFKSHD